MDQVYVVTYPEPLPIEARRIEHDSIPDGAVALAYFFRGNMIARGVVTEEGVDAVQRLLREPVPIALAVTEDDDGNIEAHVCLLLPLDPDKLRQDADDEDEPWKSSVPTPPPEVESSYSAGGDERPQLALFPIGNVVRNAQNRNHPDNVIDDAQEMLQNLLNGRAKDAVQKAIDDLLREI